MPRSSTWPTKTVLRQTLSLFFSFLFLLSFWFYSHWQFSSKKEKKNQPKRIYSSLMANNNHSNSNKVSLLSTTPKKEFEEVKKKQRNKKQQETENILYSCPERCCWWWWWWWLQKSRCCTPNQKSTIFRVNVASKGKLTNLHKVEHCSGQINKNIFLWNVCQLLHAIVG